MNWGERERERERERRVRKAERSKSESERAVTHLKKVRVPLHDLLSLAKIKVVKDPEGKASRVEEDIINVLLFLSERNLLELNPGGREREREESAKQKRVKRERAGDLRF